MLVVDADLPARTRADPARDALTRRAPWPRWHALLGRLLERDCERLGVRLGVGEERERCDWTQIRSHRPTPTPETHLSNRRAEASTPNTPFHIPPHQSKHQISSNGSESNCTLLLLLICCPNGLYMSMMLEKGMA